MWKTVKLGDLCEVVTKGTTPTSVGFKFESQGINFVKVESLAADSTFIASKFAKINSECHETLKRSQLKDGDILFSIAGALGRTAIVTEDILPANTNQALAIVRLKENVEVDRRFLLYVLNSESTREQSDSNKGGVAQQNLSLTQLKNYEVTLPPLAEQQRIVAKLDAAFTEIDRAVELETNLRATTQQLRESTLISMFSELDDDCEQMHLSDVCVDFSRGKSKHRPRNDERLYGNAIPFVQTGDVSNAKKHLNQYTKMYSEFGIEQSKQWSKGTVCITIAANIAELAILDMNACFPDSVIGALPDENITSSEYLFYLLNYFQKKIKAKSKGSAQQNINLATFSHETFPFPTLARQKQIATDLAELDASIEKIIEIRNEKIGSLHALKSAILAQELQPQQSEAA